MSDKENVKILRDGLAEEFEKVADIPDERLIEVYKICPELMQFFLKSKDKLEAFYSKYGLDPEF